MFVLTHSEVLDSLTSVTLAAQQDGVGASRRTERELVQGKDLTARIQDTLPCRTSESQGRNGEFRNRQ